MGTTRSDISLYLPCISPTSPLHLPYISPISPLYLPYISPISRVYLASKARRIFAGDDLEVGLEKTPWRYRGDVREK